MGKLRKIGRAALAAVLAFALTLPTPALAWAASGSGLAAGSIEVTGADADVWDGSVDTSWYDASKTVFTITTPAQLAGFAALVNGTTDVKAADPTFRGVTVKLGKDIVLNETAASGIDKAGEQRCWTPIGDLVLTGTQESVDGGSMPRYADGTFFDGTFDGQGHVVKNLYIYNDVEGTYGGVQGFFANVGGHATIKNMGIDGGFVYGRVAAGLVAISHVVPESDTTDPNVCAVKDGKAYCFPHIIGCFNSATVRGNGSTTRGLAGIFAGEEQYRGYNASGNGGMAQNENYHGAAYIANCYNTGDITQAATSSNAVGGIAGTGSVQIYGCYNYGRIDSDSRYAASIAGVLVGSDINVGQDSTIGFAGNSAVEDSYALDGSVFSDDLGKVKLLNVIDSAHGKGMGGEFNPAVTGEEGTYGYNATVAFKAASWFSSADSWKALSQSFVSGSDSPRLYWQAGEEQWDINREDGGERYYGIVSIGGQPALKAKFTYTGSALEPAVVMQYEIANGDGTSTVVDLHRGSDFTVSYSDNLEVGDAKVTVTGIGRFCNGRTATFKIVGGNLDEARIADIPAQWWYGAGTVNPPVAVTAANGDALKEDVDYTVSIEGVPVSADGFGADGKAKATVTVVPASDDAAFTGSTSVTFTVLRASEGLAGSGTAEDPWKISNRGDLQFLAHRTATKDGSEEYGAADKHFLVTSDIDATAHCDEGDGAFLTDRPVDPLFSHYSFGEGEERFGGFGGTFDGGGHAIEIGQTQESVLIDGSEKLTALFVYTRYGATPTFENLTVAGSSYSAGGAAAGLLVMAQPGTVTVRDCVNKAKVQGDQSFYGAAAGFIVETSQDAMTELLMENCVNEGEISSATKAAGFVANLGGKKEMFKNCVNKGSVTARSTGGAGGFVAFVQGTNEVEEAFGNVVFNGCANSGDVTVKSSGDAGGIVGWNQSRVKGLSFNRCSNTGTVTYRGTGCAGAGIMGRACSPAKFTNCYNNALIKNVNASIEPAGILGYANALPKSNDHYAQFRDSDVSMGAAGESYSFLLENVYSAGGFGSHASAAGGLIGNLWLHQQLEFSNAYFETGDGAASKAVAYDYSERWPDAIDPPVTEGEAVGIDLASMKELTFATSLGASFKQAGTADEETGALENGGLPVLQPLSQSTEIKDLSTCSIAASTPKEMSYRGDGIELTGLVVLDGNGEKLVEGEDYVAFYYADGLQGTAFIEGIGSFTGSLSYGYSIVPCDMSKCRLSRLKSLDYSDVAGAGGKQDVVVTGPAGKALVEGVDYEVLYAANMAPGTAYLMVRSKSPYFTGTLMRPFTISKGDLSKVEVRGLQDHYPSAGSSGLYLFEELAAANGHELERTDNYSADKEGKHDYVRVFYRFNGATGEYEPLYNNDDPGQGWANHVTSAGRYKVELRGDGYDVKRKDNWTNGYWVGETSAEFTYGNRVASDEDLRVEGVEEFYGQKLTADEQAVDIMSDINPRLVNASGYDLVEGEDYKLAFFKLNASSGKWEQVDKVAYAGDYKITITGQGDWYGERDVPFSVVSPYSFIGDNTQVEGVAAQYFATGDVVKPVPTRVKQAFAYGGGFEETLAAGKDYELSYVDEGGKQVDPVDPGTYYVVIKGKGDFKGAKRVEFRIEKALMSVYVRVGDGEPKLVKRYTKDQFVGLRAADAKQNPVSALYCDTSGTIWSVSSTDDYVTLADLLADAGVAWKSGASMTYASGSYAGGTYTFDQVNDLMYYPNTSASATDTWMGRKVPFVFSITDHSMKIGTLQTTLAADAEAVNLKNPESRNMPRALMGVKASDYETAWENGEKMAGRRLVKGVDSVTVTLPKADDGKVVKSANTMKVTAKSPNVKRSKKAQKISVSKAFTIKGAQGAVTFAKEGKSKLSVSKKGVISIPKKLKKGLYSIKVNVSAAGDETHLPASKVVTVKVRVK